MPNEKLAETKMMPTLVGSRIELRRFEIADAKDVQRLAGSKQVADTTATIPFPYPDGAAEEWISHHEAWYNSGDSIEWAIRLKATNELLGCVSLGINKKHNRAEIGYWMGPEFWNHGYCTEAAHIAVQFAFDSLHLGKITSRHFAGNSPSGRVMQKIGMVQEGYFTKEFVKAGKVFDIVVYGLTRELWDLNQINWPPKLCTARALLMLSVDEPSLPALPK